MDLDDFNFPLCCMLWIGELYIFTKLTHLFLVFASFFALTDLIRLVKKSFRHFVQSLVSVSKVLAKRWRAVGDTVFD